MEKEGSKVLKLGARVYASVRNKNTTENGFFLFVLVKPPDLPPTKRQNHASLLNCERACLFVCLFGFFNFYFLRFRKVVLETTTQKRVGLFWAVSCLVVEVTIQPQIYTSRASNFQQIS